MKLTSRRIGSMLRQHGYRLTPQRRAVLEAIEGKEGHQTIAEIHDYVQQGHPGIGLVTVYRIVNLLVDLGLVCRLNTGRDSQCYLMRRPVGHHHHLVCSQCGRSVDFAGCDLSELEERLNRETGFKIEDHILEIHGRCPNCCAEKKTESPVLPVSREK